MTDLDEHMAEMRAIRCQHDTPGGDQFCIFCLRKRGDDALQEVERLRAENAKLRGCWCKPVVNSANEEVGRVPHHRCPVHAAGVLP